MVSSQVSLAPSSCMHGPDLCKHVCLTNPCVVQDLSSVVSKGLMLHGMKASPSLAGLKLKPEQGRAQTNGAVSDSPTAPNSPLIAAKNPFQQVGRVKPCRVTYHCSFTFSPLPLSCLLLRSVSHTGCLCVICGNPCLAPYKRHAVDTH